MLLSKDIGECGTSELTDDEKKKNITLYEVENFFVYNTCFTMILVFLMEIFITWS